MNRRGFTLIELLTVIAIVAVLASLLIPAIAVIRTRSKVAATRAMVSSISLALEQYRLEDMRRQLPPADGPTLLYETDDSRPPTTLNLIELAGYQVPVSYLGPVNGTRRTHIDAWKRDLRYALDAATSGGAVKPAPLEDWNAVGQQPFAYVYSLGPPRGTETEDAVPAQAAGRWIYRTSGK